MLKAWTSQLVSISSCKSSSDLFASRLPMKIFVPAFDKPSGYRRFDCIVGAGQLCNAPFCGY
jgi:hypothetical protein